VADFTSLQIAGRWVLPQLTVLLGQLQVRISITIEQVGELIGSSVGVQVRAGIEFLAQRSGPDPGQPLPFVSTGAITAYADFVFDNPRNLIPVELIVSVEGDVGRFDLSDVEPIGVAPPPAPQTTSFRIALLRPDDLVNLDIEAINLALDKSDPENPSLKAADGEDAWLVVRFPAQSTAEEAFYESGGVEQVVDSPADTARQATPPPKADPLLAPGSIAARMSGNSRLVFRVPAGVRIPFTIEGLLDWSSFELQVAPIADVAPNAQPGADALAIRAPGPTESTIEMPYRLHLSPTRNVAWDHAKGAVSHEGRVELWHTRVAHRGADGSLERVDERNVLPLRAIWSPDFNPAKLQDPGDLTPLGTIAAMSAADRNQIVVLTSAFRGYAASAYSLFVPQPIEASLLMLSPLGGWLRSFGMWDPPYKTLPQFRSRGGVPFDAALLQRAPTGSSAQRASAVLQGITREPSRNNTLALPESPFESGRFSAVAGPNLVFPPLYLLGQQLDLSQWTHIAAQGRDHYVRIVYQGKLKELGHRASLVKVTERRFEPAPDTGAPVAYLRQYMYIVVREPEKDYEKDGLQQGGRAMPLKKVRLTTLVTPKIDYPYSPPASITSRSFWVMVDKKDFLFHGIAEDVAGNKIDFAKPLIFVPNSEQDLAAVDREFNDVTNRERRAAAVPGQKVTFAPPNGSNDNTSLVSLSLNFENEGVGRESFFRPRLFKAEVRIAAVEQLTGGDSHTTIRFAQRYLDHGFGDADNKTDLFAEVVKEDSAGALNSAGLDVGFAAEQAGGFATPNLAIKSLTRAAGPLGCEAQKALDNDFDPTQVFKKGLATLFGVFDLADLLPQGPADGNSPKMQVQKLGTSIVTELDWTSSVNSLAAADAIIKFHANADTALKVHGEFRKELGAPGNAAFSLEGTVNHFDVEFFNVLQVNFSEFRFKSESGKKTDVNVKLNDATPVQFEGDLEFVEGLRRLIPPGVFGDGVSIDLIENPLGVKAGLAITLPPAEVGVFALKNIAFSADLTIPFLDGKPVVAFAFARRDNPFLLAVALFGGGGFFHIELDTAGIRMLEASFEFGAVAAINLGVASGEVHIMAGIYFKMEKKASPAFGNKEIMMSLLSGYLRCGGSLCVLGLIAVSVEFYLCFAYIFEEKKAYGRATLTVSVEVACFSKSVELTVERSFGSEGGDPTFGELMDSAAVWSEYAAAYA
jgi:hypothetical protein